MKRIVIVASGGGHTGYAVALAEEFKALGVRDLLFIIPKGDKWTREKVGKYGAVREVTKPLGPKDSVFNASLRALGSFRESIRALGKEESIVVSTGSNHSIIVSLAAWFKKNPIVNIESSVRLVAPSRSGKILKHFSVLNALQWPEQLKFYPKRSEVFGPLYEKPRYPIRDEGYILVTCGTYGFKSLFDALAKTCLENVVLQTGRVDPTTYREKRGWIVFDFDPDIANWISRASVVITHIGKTAIDAALGYRKPVIIVPNPEWKRTATLDDARILAQKINAVLLEKYDPKTLERAVKIALEKKPPNIPSGAPRLAERILCLAKSSPD